MKGRCLLVGLLAAACSRPNDGRDAPPAAARPSGAVDLPESAARPDSLGRSDSLAVASRALCSAPAGGVVVSPERLGPFRTGAPMGELMRLCAGVQSEEPYTLGGIQGPARVFRFAGAELWAIQFDCPAWGEVCPEKAPGFWVARGDSVRLPGGSPMPRTIGELWGRYGSGLVLDDRSGDDSDGVQLYTCRLPHLFFELSDAVGAVAVSPSAPLGLPDSTRILGVRLWTPPQDSLPSCPSASR